MTTNNYPPQLVLQQLIRGFLVTQCIYIAAKLGIADLLKDGPRTSEELAQATGTHAPSLYRVLRLLTSTDLLTEGNPTTLRLPRLGPICRPASPVPCTIRCSCTVISQSGTSGGTCCTASKRARHPFSMSSGSHFLTMT